MFTLCLIGEPHVAYSVNVIWNFEVGLLEVYFKMVDNFGLLGMLSGSGNWSLLCNSYALCSQRLQVELMLMVTTRCHFNARDPTRHPSGGNQDYHSSCLSRTGIPWNLSFCYIYFTGQFTPKMKANAEPRLLSSLAWIDSGVVVSQHRLKSFSMK